MNKTKKGLTLEEHTKAAEIVHSILGLMSELRSVVGKEHCKVSKKIHKISSSFSVSVRSKLDDEYHKVITDDEFEQYGHIYYSVNKI